MAACVVRIDEVIGLKKVKVSSYIEQCPVLRTAQGTTLTPWQNCSIKHDLVFSGKHSATEQLVHKDCFIHIPSLSIARYSCI